MSQTHDRQCRRFLVTWRDGGDPAGIHAVGCLVSDGGWSFRYLPGADVAPAFRPFPGFPDLRKTYQSPSLFLFFADRLMDRRRPEFVAYVRALDLDDDPADADLLSRSEGVIKGDKVAVVEEPFVDDAGRTSHVFVVRGLRFAAGPPEEREAVLSDVDAGTPLQVRPDLNNPVNPDALLLLAPSGAPVGWVPDALVPYVSSLLLHAGGNVLVQRRNGPELPPHVRLLARAQGTLPLGVAPLPQLQRALEPAAG